MIPNQDNKLNPDENDLFSKNDKNTEGFFKSITSIRAIAVFFVIISHCSNIILFFQIDFKVFFYFGTIGVYIFVFLSGLLLTLPLSKLSQKNPSWKNWYKKRFIRIYPSLILATLLGILYRFFINKTVYSIDEILVHMSGLQSLPINPDYKLILSAHWYITLILTCYFIFPIFYIFLLKYFRLINLFGIFLYILFILFYNPIFDILNKLTFCIIQKSLNKDLYSAFMPRYFTFFMGISLGIWIGKKNEEKMSFFIKKKTGLIAFIFFIILNILAYIMMIFSTFLDFVIAPEYFICYPLIAISFTLMVIQILNNKPKINKMLEFSGKESYEIYLIHQIPLYIVFLLQIRIRLDFFYFLIIILSSVLLAYPLYYITNFIKKDKRYRPIVILVCLSLLFYSLLSYIIFLCNFPRINDYYSLIIFISILIALISLSYIERFGTKHMKVKIS